jgi:hypothetical protein
VGGGAPLFELERLQWEMKDFTIDPSDPAAATRPLFSRDITVTAMNLLARRSQIYAISMAHARASLTDSTLDVRGILYDTAVSPQDVKKHRPYRHSLITLAAARLSARAFDLGSLATGDGFRARRVEVDSVEIIAARNKALPPNPVTKDRRIPQRWVADLGQSLHIDTLEVLSGSVTYTEAEAGRDNRGVLQFARLHAMATNVHHIDGRRTMGDPMTLVTRAFLQDRGQLDARFVVPLDAPTFEMTYKGTLGAMPVMPMNALIEEILPVKLQGGNVRKLSFDVEVRDGISIGSVTPLYDGLALSFTEAGNDGVMGQRGLLGRAARGVVGLAAKTQIRSANPENAGAPPVIGVIRRPWRISETLPSFLWQSLKGGLQMVVRK